MIARNVVYQGHVLDILKDWPAEIINCVVTSPPFWVQRLYKGLTPQVWGGKKTCNHDWTPHIIPKQRGSLGVSGWDRPSRKVHAGNKKNVSLFCSKCGAWKGDLGNEPLISLYVEHIADIFDEVKRVLRKDGTLWLNLGDSYYGSGLGSSGKQSYLLDNMAFRNTSPIKELPRKCMADIPHRVVIELVRRGWIHRSTIIWHKPAALPESVTDRVTVDFDYLFMLTKNPTYYYEQQFEPVQSATLKKKILPIVGGNKYVNLPAPYSQKYSGKPVESRPFRNLRSVWRISTARSSSDVHFATFPTALIERPIKASCPTAVCQTCGKPRVAKYKRVRLKSPRRYEGNGKSGGLRVDEWAIHFMGYTGCKCANYAKGLVLDPFMGCYDDMTELLTKDGWIFFKDVTEDTLIATESLDGNLIYCRPSAIYSYSYSGEMYRIKTKFIDLSVTPNHRIYGRKPHTGWRFWLPEDIKSYFRFRRNTNWVANDVTHFNIQDIEIEMSAWLSFLGIWLADGHVNHSGRGHRVFITQKNRITEMRAILSRLPFKWHEHNRRDGSIRFYTSSKNLHSYLKPIGKAKHKFIPRFIMELSSEQIDIFLNAFCLGDGHRSKDGSRHFYTSSQRMADDLLECLFKSGTCGYLLERTRKGRFSKTLGRNMPSSLALEVHESRVSLTPKMSHLRDKSRPKQMWKEHYDGMVYCVEVQPSHLLYVRRNGKAVWCGNSGTTALVARALGRDWVGIELSDDYVEMTYKRLLRKKED